VILLDTSGLLAAVDSSQRGHAGAAAALRRAEGPLLLSPFVLAELDYLLARRVGPSAEHALLGEVAGGAYQLEAFAPEDIGAAIGVMERYKSLEIGLADASIVVLSERHQALDVLTLDTRHFASLRGARGKPFNLLS